MRNNVATPGAAAFLVLLSGSPAAADAAPGAKPELFALGVISGAVDVDAATFTPDGDTVFFDRSDHGASTIMVSRKVGGIWSPPQVAPFSGKWSDKDPAMAPDGGFLVFGSNRPAMPGGQPVDLVGADGQVRPGKGDHLWRVDRKGSGWGEPAPLPDVVNTSARIYSPSVAGDGSLYFQRRDETSHTFHIVRSQYRDGRYQAPAPVVIGPEMADERDPTIAPDESFIVFSANYAAKGTPNRLYISFRAKDGWGAPSDLGDEVNHDGVEGPHLGPDHRSVYFDSTAKADEAGPPGAPVGEISKIWRVSLARWLDAHGSN